MAFLLAFFSSFLVDFFGSIKIGFIGGLVSSIGLIFSAFIIQFKFSILWHFLSYGIILGLGQSLCMTVPFAILPHYFNKKLGLVNGILNTGACVILIGYTYLVGHILDYYSIEIVFYTLSCSSLFISLTSFVFKPQLPNDTSSFTLKEKLFDSLGLEILKKPKFIIWSLSLIFGVIGNATPVLTMVN